MTDTRHPSERDRDQPAPQPPDKEPSKPWRTEGLPGRDSGGSPPPRRPNWRWLAWMLVGYLLVFSLLTTQDQMAGAPTISYTEFADQVEAGNVTEVFARGDTIQGVLREPAPLPGGSEDETYEQFSTERPTFAQDDLLAALEERGATVRATPVVEQRGTLANLLFSFAPILLLVAFYYWIFRRQQQALGGGLFGSGGRKKPVDPETVRVSFDDVAGIDEV
ncbi:MAG TPA: ATP-dependent metallopeptidase FtsH/Yme1/Tma family protein, partial [Euzebyales bacterium]|nr:ATP-dependent metallopeptidase FtsH/Yme1/Tma family protein [Euzebyales bacterium]